MNENDNDNRIPAIVASSHVFSGGQVLGGGTYYPQLSAPAPLPTISQPNQGFLNRLRAIFGVTK